jgi:site-specific recombinase XerD
MTKSNNNDFYCRVNGSTKVNVKVEGESWVVVWKTKYQINFDHYKLPDVIVSAAKKYLRSRLSRSGPHSICSTQQLLVFLSKNWERSWMDFSDIKLIDFMALWNLAPVRGRTAIRHQLKRFYKYCYEESLAGADVFMSGEITSWVATYDGSYYRDLLTWHEERGAMTTSEQELLRRFLQSEGERETINQRFTRIFLWACFETIKRPSQILEMKSDALIEIKLDGKDTQYFLRVPKAKKQLGRKPELWPITNALASALITYSALGKVSSAQQRFDLLLVRDGTNEVYPIYNVSSLISRWVRSRNIISPRTNKLLTLTPYRIRHTGATALAMQGTSSTEIQYILEHDTLTASQVYIDAIGSELAPLLSKVDRKVGYIFTKLNEEFFKGSVEGYLLDKKVLIPVVNAPAVVGSCGFSGRCDKHPFFQCYNGCRYFVAWRDADHSRSLAYVESELSRWESAEGLHERSKAIKDFERIKVAIIDVIKRIDKENA